MNTVRRGTVVPLLFLALELNEFFIYAESWLEELKRCWWILLSKSSKAAARPRREFSGLDSFSSVLRNCKFKYLSLIIFTRFR
jgi:hypothetical protein